MRTIETFKHHFWQMLRQSVFTLHEIGFMVFLFGEIQSSGTENFILCRSDSSLCQELRVSRKLLRKVRDRLVELNVLVVRTARGKGDGVIMSPAGTVTADQQFHVSPSAPSTPCGARERGATGSTVSDRHKPEPSLSCSARRRGETSSEEEVIAYFRKQGFLHPEHEGGKFWKMRYWQ